MVDPTRQAVSVTAQHDEEAGEQGPTLSTPHPQASPSQPNGTHSVLDEAAASGELSDIERRSRDKIGLGWGGVGWRVLTKAYLSHLNFVFLNGSERKSRSSLSFLLGDFHRPLSGQVSSFSVTIQ